MQEVNSNRNFNWIGIWMIENQMETFRSDREYLKWRKGRERVEQSAAQKWWMSLFSNLFHILLMKWETISISLFSPRAERRIIIVIDRRGYENNPTLLEQNAADNNSSARSVGECEDQTHDLCLPIESFIHNKPSAVPKSKWGIYQTEMAVPPPVQSQQVVEKKKWTRPKLKRE